VFSAASRNQLNQDFDFTIPFCFICFRLTVRFKFLLSSFEIGNAGVYSTCGAALTAGGLKGVGGNLDGEDLGGLLLLLELDNGLQGSNGEAHIVTFLAAGSAR